MVVKRNTELLIIELTAGCETNIDKNETRKDIKYKTLINELEKKYSVEFVNLSMGAAGIIGKRAKNLKNAFDKLGIKENETDFILKKIINVCIRSTYYIFCKRNKEWDNPDLLSW